MSKSHPSATLSIIPLCVPHSSHTASLNICPCWSGSLLTLFSWPGLSPCLISYKNSTNPSMPYLEALKAFFYSLPWMPYSPSLQRTLFCDIFFLIFKFSYLCTCFLLFNCKCHWPFCLSLSPRAEPNADQCTRHLWGMQGKMILVYLQCTDLDLIRRWSDFLLKKLPLTLF